MRGINGAPVRKFGGMQVVSNCFSWYTCSPAVLCVVSKAGRMFLADVFLLGHVPVSLWIGVGWVHIHSLFT
jgi:hypothetical protein